MANVTQEFQVDKIPMSISPEHRNIYVNQVRLAVSPFDIQLALAQISAARVSEPSQELLTTVFLSPQQAKALSVALSRAVVDFERQHGPISLPEKVLNQNAPAAKKE